MDWPGWEQDVLNAEGWPVTPQNVRFLQEWHPYEESKCHANPLNTTLRYKSSTNCVQTGTKGVWVQAYNTLTQGAAATALTIAGPFFPNLHAAIKMGDPYSYPDTQGVAQDIRTWGTPLYADFYLTQVAGAVQTGGGETSIGPVAPSGYGGWRDLRNTVNRHLPTQLARSQALRYAALRGLSSPPRVGR